jgi:signal transduction histidine kinase
MSASGSEPSSPARPMGPAARWLRVLGVATVLITAGLSLGADPAPALHGEGLVVTLALATLVASVAIARRPGSWPPAGAAVAMILASVVLLWVQSGGPGVAGLFLAVAYAAMRLPLRASLAVLALAVAGLVAAGVHVGRSSGLVVGGGLGIVAFYTLASFARRVQDAHEQTASLLAEVEAGRRLQEEAAALRERSRIAREIHDVLAHSLSGLMLQLEGARMLARAPNPNGELPAALDRAHRLAQSGLEEARRAIGALRDDELPGPDRLLQLTEDFTRDSGIEATLEISGEPRLLASEAALTIFRVAQEALTNTRRHSRAGRVEVQLGYETGGVRLVVRDHARRTASGAVAVTAGEGRRDSRPGYGLTGMRERAELLSGTLEAGPSGDGFHVELWIPA